MQMHFFAIPALDPGAAQADLNEFIASHRVASVERQFVQAGPDSHWALCVSIAPAGLLSCPELDGAGAVDAAPTMDQTRRPWRARLVCCVASKRKAPGCG